MSNASRDFVSKEPRTFRFRLGHAVASSLTGFAAGVLVASIVWLVGVWYVNRVQEVAQASSAAAQNSSASALLQVAAKKPPVR